MKEISEMNIPGKLRYSKDHEWVQADTDMIRIGISDQIGHAEKSGVAW